MANFAKIVMVEVDQYKRRARLVGMTPEANPVFGLADFERTVGKEPCFYYQAQHGCLLLPKGQAKILDDNDLKGKGDAGQWLVIRNRKPGKKDVEVTSHEDYKEKDKQSGR